MAAAVFEALAVRPQFLCGRPVSLESAKEKREIARDQLKGLAPAPGPGDDRPTLCTQTMIAWAIAPASMHVFVGLEDTSAKPGCKLIYFVQQKRPICLFDKANPFTSRSALGLLLARTALADRVAILRELITQYTKYKWDTRLLDAQLALLTTRQESSETIDAVLQAMA